MTDDSFTPIILFLTNDLVPETCTIDDQEIQGDWHIKCQGSNTHDYYLLSLDDSIKVERYIHITCNPKEGSGYYDIWIEMVDVALVEETGTYQWRIMYGVPEIVGDPEAVLIGDFKKGASAGGSVLLGY